MAPRLQVKMLSNRGELLNCINCFPGQITVFRAFSDQELLPYQRALSGRQGAERFSIVLDNQEYIPHEQFLIGFGERLPVDQSVEQYLISFGAPEAALSGILVSYGLEEYSGKFCKELPECAARRVQIVASTFSSCAVLVLNNPFEPISAHWKERFAELVLSSTIQKQRITIITRLDYRPQGWIGNELVIRMQVGENIQKTIGFAGGQSDIASMVAQVRELVKDENAVQNVIDSQKAMQPTAPQITTESVKITPKVVQSQALVKQNLTSKYERQLSEPLDPKKSSALSFSGATQFTRINTTRKAALGVAGLSLLLLVFARTFFPRESNTGVQISALTRPPEARPTAIEIKPAPTTEVSAQAPVVVNKPEIVPTVEPIKVVEVEPEPVLPPPPPPSDMLLDRYPEDVKVAFISAFALDSNPVRNPASTQKDSIKVTKSSREVNPFEALRGIGEGGISAKSAPPSRIPDQTRISPQGSPASESDIERHERIRQKFLDAINRAVEEKQGNQG